METWKNKIEILFWRVAKYIIRKSYGVNCSTKDTDDFPEHKGMVKGRCFACRAKEVIEWIEEHMEVLEM